MIKSIEGHFNRRTWEWEELGVQHGLEVSWRTVKRAMNARGYHKCRACKKAWISQPQADTRVAFSEEVLHWPEWRWKQVHFSDESHFHQASRHTAWVIRNPQERHCPDCIQKKHKGAASQFHVWAMIAWNYKSPLIFYGFTQEVEKKLKNGRAKVQISKFGGPMTQQRYVDEILPIVEKRMQEATGETFTFQEDNDNSHGTRSYENIARYKKIEMDLDFIDNWPPNSPDLNPIETVWRILKSRVKLHCSMNYKELRKAIEYEWAQITLDEINEAILESKKHPRRHMHERAQQCYERNGYATEN